MITIIYDKPKKCPGLYSGIIRFLYNEKIINEIKKSDCALYDKRTKEWEVAESDLANLIDRLSLLDDIEIIDNTKIIKE